MTKTFSRRHISSDSRHHLQLDTQWYETKIENIQNANLKDVVVLQNNITNKLFGVPCRHVLRCTYTCTACVRGLGIRLGGWLFCCLKFIIFPEKLASEKANPSRSLYNQNCKAVFPSAPSHHSNSLQVSRVLIYTEKYRHARKHFMLLFKCGKWRIFSCKIFICRCESVYVLEKSSMTSVTPAVFYRIYGDYSHLLFCYSWMCLLVWVVVGRLTNKNKMKSNRMLVWQHIHTSFGTFFSGSSVASILDGWGFVLQF